MSERERKEGEELMENNSQTFIFIAGTNGAIRSCTVFTSTSSPEEEM